MIELNGTLTIEDVVAVARDGENVELTADARANVADTRDVVEDIVERDEAVYGVNTGFGNLKDINVDAADLEQQQRNLLRSHTTSVGEPYPVDVVRAMLLVRANALAVGRTGVRPLLIDRIVSLLNEGVHPVVRTRGSGDNACSLAAVGLVLIGEGEAIVDGERLSGEEALKRAGIETFDIGPKEGLAIVSGTAEMTASSALAVADLEHLVAAADLAGAWTTALVGKEPSAFDERVTAVRPYDGHEESAANVRALLPDGLESGDGMSQDPLSIRCLPQVHGTLREFLSMARNILEIELSSATGNPLIFPGGDTLSCGNFNGQQISGLADLLALTTTKVGHACERRTGVLLRAWDELPAHLAAEPGLESGMSRVHYTASSLTTEAETIGTASDRSFVTSSGQEDLHATGIVAANNLRTVTTLISRVVAAELLCAARANKFGSSTLSEPLTATAEFLDDLVGVPLGDVVWTDRLETIGESVLAGEFTAFASQEATDSS